MSEDFLLKILAIIAPIVSAAAIGYFAGIFGNRNTKTIADADVTKQEHTLGSADMQAERASLDIYRDDTYKRLVNQLDRDTTRIDALEKALSDERHQRTLQQEELNRLQAQVTAFVEEIKGLRAIIQEMTQSRSAANAQILELQGKVTKLEGLLTEANARITQLTSDLAASDAKVARLTELLNESNRAAKGKGE